MKIKNIFISNFRSFKPREKDAGANVDHLSAINVFVGSNGSGKTNFLNAVRDCAGWGRFNSEGTCFIEYDTFQGKNDSSEIILQFELPNCSKRFISLIRNNQGEEKTDHSRKEWIYPIGLPHKFSEFNKLHKNEINEEILNRNKGTQDCEKTTYAKICHAWQKIREDAKRIDINLTNDPPKEPVIIPNPKDYADRFFYDVFDNNSVPHLEGSDGIANFLLMIVKIRIREPGSVILIEEPEVSMHPRLQKQFLDYLIELAEKNQYQFLITTHSPYLLNFAVASETEEVAVFKIFKREDSTEIEQVKRNREEKWEILTDLGHTPADVLQTSCIIWVEGPSDRIYLNHWLKAADPDLLEGLHYSILPYGGKLLSHLSFNGNDKEIDEFIALRSINQNSAILMDSDRKWEGDKLNETKCRICKEFNNGNGLAWVSDGREIENYIPPELMIKAIKAIDINASKLICTGKYQHCYEYIRQDGTEFDKNKVEKIKIAKEITNDKAELDRFDLHEKINGLVTFIRRCNDLPNRNQNINPS